MTLLLGRVEILPEIMADLPRTTFFKGQLSVTKRALLYKKLMLP
jgi:hypothetical protein